MQDRLIEVSQPQIQAAAVVKTPRSSSPTPLPMGVAIGGESADISVSNSFSLLSVDTTSSVASVDRRDLMHSDMYIIKQGDALDCKSVARLHYKLLAC